MEIMISGLAGIIGYLIGSISSSRLISRLIASEKSLEDLKYTMQINNQEQKGTILTGYGGDRVSVVLGVRWGLFIGFLDMLKVILPMIIFKGILYPQEEYHLIIAITGLIGHNWPLYYRFKGGRGLSVIIGSYFVIDFFGAITTNVFGFLIGIFLLGDIMIAYPLGYFLMIPWFLLRTNDLLYFLYAVLSNVIFLISAIPEIQEDMKMRREGKYEDYRKSLLTSTPRWRGMKAIEDYILSLGRIRIIIGVFSFVTFFLILAMLPSLSFE